MSVFDAVSKKSGITIGGDFFKPDVDRISNEHKISDDVTKSRVNSLQNKKNAIVSIEETQKTIAEGNQFSNTNKVSLLSTPVTVEKTKYIMGNSLRVELAEIKAVFEETLADRLFMETVGTITIEACPIPEHISKKEAIRKYTMEMAYDIFKNMKQHINFSKIVAENKLPGFLCEIYNEAENCARIESLSRFNYDKIVGECGFDQEKIESFIVNEMSNITLLNDSLNSHFARYSAMIIGENEDVITHIKDKVIGELNNYRKSAEKLAAAKKDISDALNKGDPLNKDDEGDNNAAGKNETEPSDEKNSGDSESDAGGENPGNEDGKENKGEDPSGDGSEDSGRDGGSAGEGEKEPKGEGGSQNGKTDGETETEGTEEVTDPVSLSVTEEIEDAASFAAANSHTFNTGDEKFNNIHKKISAKLVESVNSGNIDSLVELRNQAKSAADRLRTISDGSDKKYSDSLSKLDDLSSNISFEINKLIQNKVTSTESAKTIFDRLLINVGTRFREKIALENGITTEEATKYIPGDQVLNEVLIYQTTFESLNTLRLLDFSVKETHAAFEQFLDKVNVA
jgi:hypothetical protein